MRPDERLPTPPRSFKDQHEYMKHCSTGTPNVMQSSASNPGFIKDALDIYAEGMAHPLALERLRTGDIRFKDKRGQTVIGWDGLRPLFDTLQAMIEAEKVEL